MIRGVRAGFALVLAGIFAGFAPYYALPFASALGEPNATYAEYALALLVLVPGAVAASGCCVAKRKHVKLAQIAGAVALFALAATVTDTRPMPEIPKADAGTAVSASSLASNTDSAPRGPDVGSWLALLAWLPLLSGITGKMVTQKCLKHGETITKIRV